MRLMRKRRRLPLHLRFARGYQAGFIVAIIVSCMVWYSVDNGLNATTANEQRAREATTLIIELHETSSLLGEIDSSPTSLSLRSDLVGQIEQLVDAWGTVRAGQLPDAVASLVAGPQGVADDVDLLIIDAGALGEAGGAGQTALEANSLVDRLDARRLEGRAAGLAAELGVLIGVYEAEADGVVAAMRTNNVITLSTSLVFLFLLITVLLRPLRRLMERESKALTAANTSHREEAERQELAGHLADGLEAAESEDETHRVVERAFARLIPEAPIELLLADPVKGELSSAVTHPANGGPGCGVESNWSCPAVRRGRTMVYENSASINACPHLAGRPEGACSATCVPLSFMGESMGVMHTTAEVGAPTDPALIDVLGLVANQVAVRIGTLRSFAQVELQASTDSLTGLPNRRATEDRMRRLLADNDKVAIAMADLDRFKQLNDKYGHEAGDRALRIFADAVQSALRTEDMIGRWGGEEFVLVLPGMSAHDAKVALDRVRAHVADACARAEAPAVTVSMGVVDNTQSAVADELVRLADDALLAAKTQGRDRVLVGPAVVDPVADVAMTADEVEA